MAKATYNPKKAYTWDPNGIVTMKGIEFASFYHLLTNEMNVVGGATLGLKMEAFQVMMNIFIKGVEDGQMTIVEEPIPEKLNNDPAVNALFPVK